MYQIRREVWPRRLVADEPAAHQDEANLLRITHLAHHMAAGRSAVLVATHDERFLAEVDAMLRMDCDRVRAVGA